MGGYLKMNLCSYSSGLTLVHVYILVKLLYTGMELQAAYILVCTIITPTGSSNFILSIELVFVRMSSQTARLY